MGVIVLGQGGDYGCAGVGDVGVEIEGPANTGRMEHVVRLVRPRDVKHHLRGRTKT
jgi:hypothetical protein